MSNSHHEHRDDEPDRFEPDEQPKSMLRELGEGAVQEARFSFRFALVMALVGGVVLGGLGLWNFGTPGLLIGGGAGAVAGGAVGLWAWFNA